MGQRLYVGNLPFNATAEDVRAAFEGVGPVSDVHLVADRETGRARGFAFVTMGSDEMAQTAISKLNGALLGGRPLRVNEAEDRPRGGVRLQWRASRGGFGGGAAGVVVAQRRRRRLRRRRLGGSSSLAAAALAALRRGARASGRRTGGGRGGFAAAASRSSGGPGVPAVPRSRGRSGRGEGVRGGVASWQQRASRQPTTTATT